MKLERISDLEWKIPMSGGMRVDGVVFASHDLLVKAAEDRAVDQVANVAHLPGIVKRSMAMPDIHWGYGFPIGGVAATDVDSDGVVSPGGVGFDIGCGVRLLSADTDFDSVADRIREIAEEISRVVPHGVGGTGMRSLDRADLAKVMADGVRWALLQGVGYEEDAIMSEDGGVLADAEPGLVSDKAYERGSQQLGSLGAGNHFLEVQVVDRIFAQDVADVLGLAMGQICVMIHSGSRGLGHQVCSEEVRKVEIEMKALGIEVPDRQLACVPVKSEAGKRYMGAMAAAANFARTNRHFLADGVRSAFLKVLGDVPLRTVYDVSHNIAKIEEHSIDGTSRKLCVHRKGATRSFGPGHPDLPPEYSQIGQPVIVPGSMGTASYVAVGTERAADLSFGSTCHGAGRMMSRKAATKHMKGTDLKKTLGDRGIVIRAKQMRLLAEEAPDAYKDVDEVIDVCDRLGLARKAVRLRPVAVVKG